MYSPTHFAQADRVASLELLSRHPFATLVTMPPAGAPAAQGPFVDHVPLLAVETGGELKLFGHFSRANPHAVALENARRTLAIFRGPDAYISPRWYRDYDVPTWNYAAVHVSGPVRLVAKPDELLALIEKLVAHFEAPLGGPSGPLLPSDLPTPEILFKAIVGFEILAEELIAKFKLSQNRTEEDQARVESALRASKCPQDHAVAALMRTINSGPDRA